MNFKTYQGDDALGLLDSSRDTDLVCQLEEVPRDLLPHLPIDIVAYLLEPLDPLIVDLGTVNAEHGGEVSALRHELAVAFRG